MTKEQKLQRLKHLQEEANALEKSIEDKVKNLPSGQLKMLKEEIKLLKSQIE
jgi:hypothetical protein